jgi:hypothetical protein
MVIFAAVISEVRKYIKTDARFIKVKSTRTTRRLVDTEIVLKLK